MNKRNLLAASLAALLSTSAMAAGGFLVAPERAKFDFDKVETKKFILTNTSDEPIRLSIKPEFIPMDSKHISIGSHIESYDNDDDLTPFVRVAPRIVSLEPGERRDIRVQVRPSNKLTNGDYRTHLLVENIATAQEKAVVESSDDIKMNIALRMQTAIALYARRGDYSQDLSFECADKGVTVTNSSAYMFEGKVNIDSKEARPALMMRESERTFTFDEPFAKAMFTSDETEETFKVNCSK
ncbi:hypothetical protein [Vibrio owensii]|uniref:hypothetical protein n=1 Tax=Vibrio harveyi group TaxID=717610 RepID=UPI003CC57244